MGSLLGRLCCGGRTEGRESAAGNVAVTKNESPIQQTPSYVVFPSTPIAKRYDSQS